jgi:hypothetical protein
MMRRLISTIMLAFTATVPVVIVSCTTGACFDETNSYLKASMYSYSKKTALPVDSLTLYGLNHESDTIYNKSYRVNPVQFPLDASTGNSAFVIIINKVTDTISFSYSTYPHLISKECGYTFYHDLDTFPIYTKHAIDSVSLRKNKITTVNEENIRIFY